MQVENIFSISQQGMALEKKRVDVVANNIANQHSIQSKNGVGFTPQRVISHARAFENHMSSSQAEQGGITDISVVPEDVTASAVYQPGHPNANDKGYVYYPGVNTIDEIATLIRASRAYEANIKMLNAAHSMALQALSIGDEK